jgi:4-methyl-5(b-hydroxyethyl)-thiazole monophosphate biosynthesis
MEIFMKKVAVLLAEGFEEVEAVTPIDFLRRADITVYPTKIGESNSKIVKGSRGIFIEAEYFLQDLPDNLDAVILPGGMPGAKNLSESEEVIELLKTMIQENKIICAICAAPAVVLNKHNLLDGHKATCFPSFEKEYTEVKYSPERVVIDGQFITSQGAGTAAEFSIAIIKQLVGEEAALKIHKATLQK